METTRCKAPLARLPPQPHPLEMPWDSAGAGEASDEASFLRARLDNKGEGDPVGQGSSDEDSFPSQRLLSQTGLPGPE
ncbi:hypothetical protein NDU88_003106 [Pleurodeles waltl]|uniref:Uncharacterized protein n=1 Tax=Pleurodeles waltl TaxID=8319 RepID=A0AAV7M595_PLEWA|nr:hypothetical protein NDU88_003106 [Pleurodeles waltl]